jgi:hypothetical protein
VSARRVAVTGVELGIKGVFFSHRKRVTKATWMLMGFEDLHGFARVCHQSAKD